MSSIRPLVTILTARDLTAHVADKDSRAEVISSIRSGITLGELQDIVRNHARADYILLLDEFSEPIDDIVDVLADAISAHSLADALYGDYLDFSATAIGSKMLRRLASRNRNREFAHSEALGESWVLQPDWSPYRLRTDNYVGNDLCIRADVFASMAFTTVEREATSLWPVISRLAKSNSVVAHDGFPWLIRTSAEAATASEAGAKFASQGDSAQADAWSASVTLVTLTAGYRKPVRGVVTQFFEQHLASIQQSKQAKHRDPRIVEHLVVIGPECDDQLRVDLASHTFNVTVINAPGEFNFAARANLASQHARGDILIFLNDDLDFRVDNWLDVLLAPFEVPRVGIVGATLLYENDSIQHAGVEIDRGTYSHVGHGLSLGDPTNAKWFTVDREVDAVTGACFAIRAELFERLGGFFVGFPLNFNDVDVCLKARLLGYSIIQTAAPIAYHYESLSRPSVLLPEELVLMHHRWPETFAVSKHRFG